MSHLPLRVPKHVHWRRFDAEIVLVDLHRGEYFGLNDVAADAFERLAGGADRDEVVRALLETYDVSDATLRTDIEGLVEDLVARGFLVHEGHAQ